MKITGYAYDDGGRAAAGFRGSAGDCAARAVAIATGIPYVEARRSLIRGGRGQIMGTGPGPEHGVTFRALAMAFAEQGFRYHAMRGTFRGTDLPDERVVVLVTDRHVTTVIDGIIHDNHDPRLGGTGLFNGFHGYFIKEAA